ncbi:MAG: adenylate kinase [Parcubacteria group bacterium Gr01-1014_24]|nr:MAG: adenylate kinase [Parcubacteria group bacterium Gr01-1014_24]
MQSSTFVFFGNVGSGKGTQVKLLMDFLRKKDGRGCVYVYPGDEYRELAKRNSLAGSLVKGPISRGELLPGFLTDAIVVNILISNLSKDKHLIIDGYPRAVTQSTSFEQMMNFFERDEVKIICIGIGEEEAKKRNFLRRRHDDTEEGLEQRLKEYKDNVIPALKYFEDKPDYKTYQINGEQSIEDVHEEIIKKLGY